jgi:hypothetical protein
VRSDSIAARELATEFHAARLRACPAFASTRADQFALKLGEAAPQPHRSAAVHLAPRPGRRALPAAALRGGDRGRAALLVALPRLTGRPALRGCRPRAARQDR